VEHLDRHEPVELRLPPLVDDAHAAFTEAPEHLVTSVERPPDQRVPLWFGLEQVYDHRGSTISRNNDDPTISDQPAAAEKRCRRRASG
jgi:hypothetical protein